MKFSNGQTQNVSTNVSKTFVNGMVVNCGDKPKFESRTGLNLRGILLRVGSESIKRGRAGDALNDSL